MAISNRTILAFSIIMAVISILAFGFVAFELLRDGDGGGQTLTFEEFHSDRLGYSIEIPEGWVLQILRDEADGETRIRERFYATSDRNWPFMTVSKWPAGDLTVERLLSSRSFGIGVFIETDALVVAGHDAVREHVVDMGFDETRIHVIVDDTRWTLALAVGTGNRDEYLPIFERVYNSFQLK